jgi:toxin-antitoxin system PIN domain toxin
MSFSLDVNILLYASDSSSAQHRTAAELLASVADGNEACYISWLTAMSYLRMATHPRLFAAPLSQQQAENNINDLMGRPHVHCIAEGDDFWDVYREVAGEIPVRGNLVPDAHLAALLRQHGIRTLYTHDRDFLKFPFLRIVDPFE